MDIIVNPNEIKDTINKIVIEYQSRIHVKDDQEKVIEILEKSQQINDSMDLAVLLFKLIKVIQGSIKECIEVSKFI